jgi:hypothetical protein
MQIKQNQLNILTRAEHLSGVVHEGRKHEAGAVAKHQVVTHHQRLEVLGLARGGRHTHADNTYGSGEEEVRK